MARRLVLEAALVIGLVFLSCEQVFAQVAPFTYRLRSVSMMEDATKILIKAQPPIAIRILPGGHMWPLLAITPAIFMDESMVSGKAVESTAHSSV